MDEKWFKSQLKAVGKTAGDVADAAGRARAGVSHILSGQQRMNLEWAQAFAQVLNVPVATVLEKAGSATPRLAQQLQPGFAESDTVPWISTPEKLAETAQVNSIASAFGQRQGMDIWRVSTPSMNLAGMLVGDYMLVDTNLAEQCRPGDVVVARIYARNGFNTVLRRYAPPVLVAHSADPTEWKVHVVDGENVVIRGKVVATWRLAA